MIFFKQYLITLTFTVLAVWVIPANTHREVLTSKDSFILLFYNDYNICVLIFILSKFISNELYKYFCINI